MGSMVESVQNLQALKEAQQEAQAIHDVRLF